MSIPAPQGWRTTNKKPQKELPFPQRKRKRRQKCCSYCEDWSTIGLCLATLESQRGAESRENPRCKEFWDQFDKYDSHSPRYVKQVFGKIKDYRLETYESKFLINEVPTLWNLRTDLRKRLKDNSDAPEARNGIFPKTYTSSQKRTMLQSSHPRKNGYCGDATCRNPQFLPLGKLCEDHGYTCHWTSGQKPHLTKIGKKINCNISNYVPFGVPGLSTSSFTSSSPATSSTSSSQDSVIGTENPATERSWSMSAELRGNPLQEPAETGNPNKKKTTKNYKVKYCVIYRIGHRSSEIIWFMKVFQQSHGETRRMNIETLPVLLMKYQWSREQQWNRARVCTVLFRHFPKDPNCHICLETKITRASCRRRTGTVVPRAENFGDLTTAENKVLSEGSESRNNHRYAVVVQDLATQWLQPYPCKTKTSQETQKNLMKFLEPTRKPKVIYTDNSLEFGRQHHTDQKQMGLSKEQCAEWKKGHLRCCRSPVWVTNGGRIPWNAIAICGLLRIFDLMGRHPMKGGSEYHLTDQ